MADFELIVGNVRLSSQPTAVDIGVKGGRIAAIGDLGAAPGQREDGLGSFAFSGFVESHIHLDKAAILDRCPICAGTLAEAVVSTTRAKLDFTVDDVWARGARVLEKAILAGTSQMRSFVEVDPRAGLRSFEALRRLRRDFAFAIDLEICAFAQEGLTQEMETLALLEEALRSGADLVGGCPYTDPDPEAHIGLIFDLAQRYGARVDFHLDFDLDPHGSMIGVVARETESRGLGGRVSIGHASKLSAMPPEAVVKLGRSLADAGIGLTVMPATDLFLMGRSADRLVPRGIAPARQLAKLGVTVSVASNNLLNPFTPYGDASLCRMANLYANADRLGSDDDLASVFAMVSDGAARLLGRPYGLAVGGPADIVLLDAVDPVAAIREIAAPLAGWKRGRKVFSRPRAELLRP